MKKIEDAWAKSADCIVLSDENSPWGADVYISVTKEVPNAEMAKISGTYLAKVFEGPYGNIGRWTKEMQDHVKTKGKTVKRLIFYYTTCPKCAKTYNKNFVVMLAETTG